MKRPLIGLNMNYKSYSACSPSSVTFRDSYWIHTPYVEVVCEAGGIPIPVGCIKEEEVLREYVERVDGFLFIGCAKDYPPESYGEARRPDLDVCHERRYSTDFSLAKLVLADGMPVLGICGGMQLISIVLGGKVIQHLETAEFHKACPDKEEREHYIDILPETVLARSVKSTRILVNSSHHQAVRPQHVGRKLRVVAKADDGVIEAVESVEGRFLMGVQWHPERIRNAEHTKMLFGAFVEACRKG